MSSEGKRFTSSLVHTAGLSQVQLLENAIFVTITGKLRSYKASAHPVLTLGKKIMVWTRLLFQTVRLKLRSHKSMNENIETYPLDANCYLHGYVIEWLHDNRITTYERIQDINPPCVASNIYKNKKCISQMYSSKESQHLGKRLNLNSSKKDNGK